MEPLVFAMIAARHGYKIEDTMAPEPGESQPFALWPHSLALRRTDNQPMIKPNRKAKPRAAWRWRLLHFGRWHPALKE